MTPTLYAAFDDASQAEAAAVALLERGVPAKEISLVVNEKEREKRETHGVPPAKPPVVVDEGLNPAQNDYPRTGEATSEELSSRPPNSPYDYNKGLERDDYVKDYDRDVEREIAHEGHLDAERVQNDEIAPNEPVAPPTPPVVEHVPADPIVEHQLKEAGVSRPTIPTTAATVGVSAGLGIGVGALAAVAAIAVPGVGLVLGGGALATAIAGLAATSSTGASAEGIVGYLKDQGVPADAIPKLRTAYETGGAILSVTLNAAPADRIELESIVRSGGASQVGSYGYAA